MKVVVLAAGAGSRLFPFTTLIPKLMIPAGSDQRPVGYHILKHCQYHSLNEFLFCINKHDEKQIKNYFEDGKRFGALIKYSATDKPQGTAGELLAAYNNEYLEKEEDLLIYYGDTLARTNISELIQRHDELAGDVSITVNTNIRIPVGYVEHNDYVSRIIEKPKLSEIVTYPSLAGGILPIFYVTAANFIPDWCDFDEDIVTNIFPLMLESDYNVLAYRDETPFIDMGSWKNIERARDEW